MTILHYYRKLAVYIGLFQFWSFQCTSVELAALDPPLHLVSQHFRPVRAENADLKRLTPPCFATLWKQGGSSAANTADNYDDVI